MRAPVKPFLRTAAGKILLTLVLSGLLTTGYGQERDAHPTASSRIDSVLNSLSLREKIGQLFMVAAYPGRGAADSVRISRLIAGQKIGGIIMMQGSPYRQAVWTNAFQSQSRIPLLMAFDGEWGLAMRMDSVMKFPWNMSLGAIRNDSLLYELGKSIGEQHRRMGLHLNFAPVVDINSNPLNPIIGNRSFGEVPGNVATKSLFFLKGMQDAGVMGCAKHFPGHGDTYRDSHKELPVVRLSYARLDSVEWLPYKRLIPAGLSAVMSAHLEVPALDSTPELPASLSPKVLLVLRDSLHFDGLIVTDALNMKGASGSYPPGILERTALLAGNDILLFSQDVPKAVDVLEKAVLNGDIPESRIDAPVRRILAAKLKAGLFDHPAPVELEHLTADLNDERYKALNYRLTAASLTLVKRKDTFPVIDLQRRFAYFHLGDAPGDTFLNTLRLYTAVDDLSALTGKALNDTLTAYDRIIIGFHKSSAHPWKSYRFSPDDLRLLKDIAGRHPHVLLTVFTSPYSLNQVDFLDSIDDLLIAYQNGETAQSLAAQAVFGAISVNGQLPVSAGSFPAGYGLYAPSLQRLRYGFPALAEMHTRALARIDSIMEEVVRQQMAPGGVVLVARNGMVVYHKAFGYHTGEQKQKVRTSDLYDLASLTKILASLPMVMHDYEAGRLDLDATLVEWMPFVKGSNKDSLRIRKILSHYARLQAWIPFYLSTLDSISGEPLPLYYHKEYSADFPEQVAKRLYLRADYRDTIYKKILESPLREKPGYKYSGLIFYLLVKHVEQTYGMPLDAYLEKHLYRPLGATTMGYLPLKRFDRSRIVPTEKDDYYRHELLHGRVHDMGAAMMGGVSGNAGLFANANDVAKVMQMYLQGGYYGGKRYFYSRTLDTFNHAYYARDSVRRGLIFDKPQIDPEEEATCGCWSYDSFGHSGFTGTYAWADPRTGLLYVFLSNRVYPTMQNKKLIEEDIRTKIQGFIREAIGD